MIKEALAALKYSIVASGIYPIALVQEYPHRVDRLRSTLASLRLKVFHLEASAKALSRFYLVPLPSAEKRIFVVIGSEERFQNVLAALKKNRFSEFHAQLGIPQCCIDFLERLKQSSTREVVWPVALNSMSEQGASQTCEIQSKWQTSLVLEPLGLNFLNYTPCRISCAASIEKAERIGAVAEKGKKGREIGWLQEILSWPISWSTLHGISEIKTPVFKCITKAQPTAVKYEVRFTGTSFPPEGAKGLGFPFRQPNRLIFSDSIGFNRGLKNPI